MTKQEIKLTFSPVVWFESRPLFKVLKCFYRNFAFTDGIPTKIMYTLKSNVPDRIASTYNENLS